VAAKGRPVMRSAMQTPQTDGSVAVELASTIDCLTEEKRRRMSSAEADRGDEGLRDTDHLRSQFLIVIQKDHFGNTSRMEGRLVVRN
jgi:hypothetical protein